MATPETPRTIDARQVDYLIEETERQFNGWLERLTKNGPSDTEGAAGVLASSTRYEQLKMIRRGYLSY